VLADEGRNSSIIPSHKTNKAESLLKEAIVQYDQNKYQNALEIINSAIDLDPLIPEAWTLRGKIRDMLSQHFSEIESDCIHAIQINPNRLESYITLLSLCNKHMKSYSSLNLMAQINQIFYLPIKSKFNPNNSQYTSKEKYLLEREAHNHISREMYSKIVERGEKILSYWLFEFIWNKHIDKNIRQLPGNWKYGYGYILLTNKKAYFVSLGHISERLFRPDDISQAIYPNEPYSEEIETRTIVKEINYQDLKVANDDLCQPILEEKVWKIQTLNDFEDSISFLYAFKSGLFGNIDKWFVTKI
jgi:tetratricopeptide (TPR) repeat protein